MSRVERVEHMLQAIEYETSLAFNEHTVLLNKNQELEAENTKLRELCTDMWRFTGAACKKYPRLFDPAAQGPQTVQLNALDSFEQRMRELGLEVSE